MSQYRPIMAGHPATQRLKAEEKQDLSTTLLHIASLEGDVRRLEELLRQGNPVDLPDQANKTALHLAAQYGQMQSMILLLRAGADGNARSDLQETPLIVAAQAGQLSACNGLLQLGVDLKAADQKGRTALHHAAMAGNCPLIAQLLESGADVQAEDEFASTPLYLAAKQNRAAAVRQLLSWKANPLTMTAHKSSAIHAAISHGQAELVSRMVEGVPPADLDNLADSQQNNPLHAVVLCAGDSPSARSIASTLLQTGMQVNQRGMMGWTPLNCAVRSKNVSMAELLMHNGADPSKQAVDGTTIHEFVQSELQRGRAG